MLGLSGAIHTTAVKPLLCSVDPVLESYVKVSKCLESSHFLILSLFLAVQQLRNFFESIYICIYDICVYLSQSSWLYAGIATGKISESVRLVFRFATAMSSLFAVSAFSCFCISFRFAILLLLFVSSFSPVHVLKRSASAWPHRESVLSAAFGAGISLDFVAGAVSNRFCDAIDMS